MKFQLTFNNGTQGVDLDIPMDLRSTPVELVVPRVGDYATQKRSVNLTKKTIDYLFRGVTNFASGDIESLTIEKPWFGKITKHMDSVKWDCISENTFVVVYDISRKEITENIYLADNVVTVVKDGKTSVETSWLDPLINPEGGYVKENIISSIAVATRYLKDYRLAWGFNGVRGLTILNKQGVPTPLDRVDDETYIVCRLLTLLMSRGTHMGVFLVDCRGLSDDTLRALTATAQEFYGDSFIFLSNVKSNSRLERERIEIPNFLFKG